MTGRRSSKYGTVADHPELAAQFDVERSGERTPEQVNAGTPEKLWWSCAVADDHRWQATGLNRVRGGTGCPACAGPQPSTTNNLARFPAVAAQFDVAANGDRTPEEIVATTEEKLWWICPVPDDHRWQAKGPRRGPGARAERLPVRDRGVHRQPASARAGRPAHRGLGRRRRAVGTVVREALRAVDGP